MKYSHQTNSVDSETPKMLVLILVMLPFASCNKSIEYLTYYGYLDQNALTQDITPAVKQFQETFRLEPTGVLDNATLELMAKPRCGFKDNILPFSALPNRKWNSTVITWYQYGTPQYTDLIEKAFAVWGKHANITFKKAINYPTIIISLSAQRRHYDYSRHGVCPYDFDGPGLVLGHAYLPTARYNQTDIHMDSEENWDFTMNLPRNGQISFFLTLVHEIGHALGLDHSSDNTSVMYPFNRDPVGIVDFYEYELSRDDRLAIQFLYGTPPVTTSSTTTSTSTSTTTTTTTTTTSTTPKSENLEERNICEFKNEINTYLIVNKKIFAFLREYVWVLSLDPAHRTVEEYTRPKRIIDWLRFLPQNFTEVEGIYQRPDGNIALFVGNDVYIFRYPSLSFIVKYNLNTIAGRHVNKINAVLSTNQGKTYLLFDDWYLYEIKECSYAGTFMGGTSTVLYGIPGNVNGAFRYINGRIYFITDSGVLEYNEFTNVVTRSESTAFDVLQITCIRETLLNRLYEVLKYLQ